MAAFNFPNSPNSGDTYTANGVTFVYDSTNGAWKKNPASATKGDKGQKGEQGIQGNPGADNSTKGQKGEKGATGADNSTKGQKGEEGADNSTKGQKGDDGASGSTGIPVGTIIMYGGTTAPTGWQLCDGATPQTTALQTLLGGAGQTVPDLRDKFIVGAGVAYNLKATGGSANATLVSHSHTINNHTHSFSGSNTHNHSFQGVYGNDHNDSGRRAVVMKNDSNSYFTAGGSPGSGVQNATISISGTTGNPSDTGTNAQGSSATNANLPPYYALTYIIKY